MFKSFVCAAILSVASFAATAAEIGQPAPAFSVTDIAGKEQSLDKYKGKVVVLEWTNPECPFVQKHYGAGNMQSLQQYAASKGVVWISVNSSASGKEGFMDAAQAKAKVTETGAHPTAYITDPEGSLGKLYGAKATPHMFVIDTSGILVYEGAIDNKPTPDAADIKSADNYVKDAIDSVLAGKKVEVPQTRAYGCSVKYSE